MDRKQTAKGNIHSHSDDNFVPGTPASRIKLVWPLTKVLKLTDFGIYDDS